MNNDCITYTTELKKKVANKHYRKKSTVKTNPTTHTKEDYILLATLLSLTTEMTLNGSINVKYRYLWLSFYFTLLCLRQKENTIHTAPLKTYEQIRSLTTDNMGICFASCCSCVSSFLGLVRVWCVSVVKPP